MKSVLRAAACVGLALSGFPLLAQLHDNSEKQMTCQDGGSGDRARHCDIREQSLPALGSLDVDSSPNGGVSVNGWQQSAILVRARVQAYADSQSAADLLASQVAVTTAGGQVRANGPSAADGSSWSVSYEIFVPQATNLTVKSVNGGVNISDIRGQIRFDAVNGGVHLRRVAGDVGGATVNGGISAELAGSAWQGRQLDIRTQNGGVNLALPASYSAHVRAETSNGHIQSDFPATVTGELRPRQLEFDLGSGGPLIHVATHNGGIRLQRAQ